MLQWITGVKFLTGLIFGILTLFLTGLVFGILTFKEQQF